MVIWADPAKSDLRSIHDFVVSDSRYYAKKVVQDIMDRTNILEEYPRSGRKVPEMVLIGLSPVGTTTICDMAPIP